jgi:aminopeptidase N
MVGSADLAPADLVAMVGTHLPVEDHSSVWEGVFDRMLTRVLPCSFPATSVAVARTELAETCAATLRAGHQALALPATRGLAACTSDADVLAGWLVAGRTGHAIDVDTNLRWRIIHRLAELDGVGPDRIQKEAADDPSTQAETGAVRAAAALPSPDAKQRAWDLMSADDVSNRSFTAAAEGFWVPEQAELLTPYVGRYLEEAPGWAARRGQGFSVSVAAAFPLFAVDETTAAGLQAALAGDVPTVLRRLWDDILDDLVMTQKARTRWT